MEQRQLPISTAPPDDEGSESDSDSDTDEDQTPRLPGDIVEWNVVRFRYPDRRQRHSWGMALAIDAVFTTVATLFTMVLTIPLLDRWEGSWLARGVFTVGSIAFATGAVGAVIALVSASCARRSAPALPTALGARLGLSCATIVLELLCGVFARIDGATVGERVLATGCLTAAPLTFILAIFEFFCFFGFTCCRH